MTTETFTSRRIVRMLSNRIGDLRPAVKAITAHATIPSLLSALRNVTNPHVRQILCDILGNRHDASAVQMLLRMLNDEHSGVRAAAADALAKIGSTQAGPILLERFQSESDDGVRQMLAAALGATGYRPSARLLIKSLSDRSAVLRGCAAWSLGHLMVKEAKEPLTKALQKEKSDYAANRMKAALEEINGS